MFILHDGRQVSRTASSAAAGTHAPDKVPALTKAMSIVRYLNRANSTGVSLHQIAGDLRITKSHCYNILKTLEHGGWLSCDLQRRTYALAPGLLSDVSRLIGRQSPVALIHEELARLSTAVDTPCVLTRIERDGGFVAIDKAEEASGLIYSVPIGYRFPSDAPAQMRVRLAWMNVRMAKRELARWRPRRYTNTTIVGKKAAWAEIEATRKRGYAISRAEFYLGVMTLAVPIFDSRGKVQLVLQCPGLIEHVRRNQAKIAVELVRTAERLSLINGGAQPASKPDSP